MNSFHQAEANVVPQSEIIWSGRPCRQKTLLRNWRARSQAVLVILAGTKWARLVNRSTITSIALNLSKGGRGPMWYHVMEDQGRVGMGNGLRGL